MRIYWKWWGPLLVVLTSSLPLLALLNSGLPLTHDGQDHVARIANFYSSLTEGNLVPRWAENLNWGYGHPVLMFLYPLSSYVASLFHFIGFSLVNSVKIVFALSFVLSGITMYLWLREFLGKDSAILGSILYNFAPYRFVDLYVRGAIGEHVAFIFPPLICFFLLKHTASKKFNYLYFSGAALSIAGLILAHNAITLVFLPFIIFYTIYLILSSKDKLTQVYQHTCVVMLGFAAASFFWLPAFVEGKYTLRDIVTEGVVFDRFVDFQKLISSPWNFGQSGEFSVEVGLLFWLAFLCSPIVVYKLYKQKKNELILYTALAVCFLGSIFLMLPASKFIWQSATTLQKFQFPWRFLVISVFSGSALVAFSICLIKNSTVRTYTLFAAILFTLIFTRNFWQPKDYLIRPESFYSGIYSGTTDTGESSPIWSVRFMEARSVADAEVIQGEGEIRTLGRTSTHHEYEVTTNYGVRMRENTLYFPGWKVYIDGKEYMGVQFQDPKNRGLMTFYVNQGKHKVDVKFENTRLRTFSNYLSLLALGLLGALGMLGLLRKSEKSAK